MYLHLKKYFPQVEIKSKVSKSKTTEKEPNNIVAFGLKRTVPLVWSL